MLKHIVMLRNSDMKYFIATEDLENLGDLKELEQKYDAHFEGAYDTMEQAEKKKTEVEERVKPRTM